MRCASYCLGASYDLAKIAAAYTIQTASSVQRYDEVVVISLNETQCICIFRYGAVVFWNFTPQEELQVLESLKTHLLGVLSTPQEDTCTFEQGSETHVDEEDDRIILHNDDPLLKLSLSYGLSQSVKLSAFEQEIDDTIKSTRHFPAELAEKGKIKLSRKKISQYIGKLFSQKNSINLDAYVLDTPEFFWKRPRYEPFYEQAIEYLDIRTRLNILNGKLNIIHELYDILSNELKHAHSSFLEWVIIVLILTEVALSILKDFL